MSTRPLVHSGAYVFGYLVASGLSRIARFANSDTDAFTDAAPYTGSVVLVAAPAPSTVVGKPSEASSVERRTSGQLLARVSGMLPTPCEAPSVQRSSSTRPPFQGTTDAFEFS